LRIHQGPPSCPRSLFWAQPSRRTCPITDVGVVKEGRKAGRARAYLGAMCFAVWWRAALAQALAPRPTIRVILGSGEITPSSSSSCEGDDSRLAHGTFTTMPNFGERPQNIGRSGAAVLATSGSPAFARPFCTGRRGPERHQRRPRATKNDPVSSGRRITQSPPQTPPTPAVYDKSSSLSRLRTRKDVEELREHPRSEPATATPACTVRPAALGPGALSTGTRSP